jgi:hypothetical protein
MKMKMSFKARRATWIRTNVNLLSSAQPLPELELQQVLVESRSNSLLN